MLQRAAASLNASGKFTQGVGLLNSQASSMSNPGLGEVLGATALPSFRGLAGASK